MQALYRDRLPGSYGTCTLWKTVFAAAALRAASDLKTAISDNQFRIYLQPQICLQDLVSMVPRCYCVVALQWLNHPQPVYTHCKSAGQIEITE